MIIKKIENNQILLELEDEWEKNRIKDGSSLDSIIISKEDNENIWFSRLFIKTACRTQKKPFEIGISIRLLHILNNTGNSHKPSNFITCNCSSAIYRLDGDMWCLNCSLRTSIHLTHTKKERQKYETVDIANKVEIKHFKLKHSNDTYPMLLINLPTEWRLKRSIIDQARKLKINHSNRNEIRMFCKNNGLVFKNFYYNSTLAHRFTDIISFHRDYSMKYDQAENAPYVYLSYIEEDTGLEFPRSI